MKVTYANETYDCTRAVRESDKATLYLMDGGVIAFGGVSEAAWDKFQFEGGGWEDVLPMPSDAERLAALESAMMAIMMGGTGNV